MGLFLLPKEPNGEHFVLTLTDVKTPMLKVSIATGDAEKAI
jgi:hypothetical protein